MGFSFRISHKINSIGVLGIVGMLTLGGLYWAGDASQSVDRKADRQARAIGELQNRVTVTILQMRRAEKDFLLRKDEKYVADYGRLSTRLAADLAELERGVAASDQATLKPKIQAIEIGTADYKKHFEAMVAARTKLGLNENAGLEGGLRKSVHAIEAALTALDDPSLTRIMLMMRRHEKDFMLRGDTKYGDDIKARAVEFRARLAASEIAPSARADLGTKLDAYQRDFSAWMETSLVIAAEQKAISESFARIQPVIEEVEQAVGAASERAQKAELASREATKSQMQIGIGAIIAAVGLLGVMIGRSVSRPLKAMNVAVQKLGDGQLDMVLPGLDRHDEIGEIARSIRSCKTKAEQRCMDEAAAKAAEDQRHAQERRQEMFALADRFEKAVGEIIETVSSASTELEASATTLTSTAMRAQELAGAVASASEEASTNVQSVASATEEMASSVTEISRQVQNSSRIAGEAVDQARNTNARVGELSQAASRIGDVVELINTIAGQTNLLALNATIEAARAGEAGRGFAVVASEVKALAEQTAKATGEISQQINGIQQATEGSVAAIQEIGVTIGQMSEISSTIAAAVEEQGAATQEISRNIHLAAEGTQQVSSNVCDVQRGATATGSASSQVLSAAKLLSRDSTRLKDEVGRFLLTVRAA